MVYDIVYMDEQLEVDFELDIESLNEYIEYICLGRKPYSIYLDINNYITVQSDDIYTIDPKKYSK